MHVKKSLLPFRYLFTYLGEPSILRYYNYLDGTIVANLIKI